MGEISSGDCPALWSVARPLLMYSLNTDPVVSGQMQPGPIRSKASRCFGGRF